MDYDDGYLTPEEQAAYKSMLKEHSQPTGIFIDDFYKETSPESIQLSGLSICEV